MVVKEGQRGEQEALGRPGSYTRDFPGYVKSEGRI